MQTPWRPPWELVQFFCPGWEADYRLERDPLRVARDAALHRRCQEYYAQHAAEAAELEKKKEEDTAARASRHHDAHSAFCVSAGNFERRLLPSGEEVFCVPKPPDERKSR